MRTKLFNSTGAFIGGSLGFFYSANKKFDQIFPTYGTLKDPDTRVTKQGDINHYHHKNSAPVGSNEMATAVFVGAALGLLVSKKLPIGLAHKFLTAAKNNHNEVSQPTIKI